MPWPSSFTVDDTARAVTLADGADASAAFQQAVDAAIEGGLFPQVLAGRHSEYFRILGARDFTRVERFAATLFGIATRGAHLTAYVRGQNPHDDMKIWVARRSSHLFTY